ncbi:AAA family ATPase [Vibrio parahaemolyticus]|nr:AAA family ATPase [Vibrio parahaemolyticus]
MKNIFISGIHGVGKTTLSKLLSECLGLRHYSCSSLIKQYVEKTDTGKFVSNIDKNQTLLIKAYNSIRQTEPLILDGHLTLLDKKGKPTPIDSSVFRELDIGVFILVTDEIETTLSRLSARDSLNWNLDYIRAMKELELITIRKVSKELGVHLIEYKNNSNIDDLIRTLGVFHWTT